MPQRSTRRSFFLVTATALLVAGCDSGTTAQQPAEAEKAPAAPVAVQKDWTAVVVRTPEGGFRMGNPDAEVKLIEFASFTCSHCKDFYVQSQQGLKQGFIKDGRVSLEFRPFMLNVYDFAAAQLAICEGPDRFFMWTGELYDNHDSWLQPFARLTEADIQPLQSLPPEQQLQALAEKGDLDDFARVRGLPKARFDGCLSNQETLDRLTETQKAAVDEYKISGTPSFVMNGKKLDGVASWEQLQPLIADALK